MRSASIFISTKQITSHIAAYGGLASTAKHLGLSDDADRLSDLVDQVKEANERYTRMAEERINERASN